MSLPKTPPETFTTCPHERGPGTTVCLRCRAAERAVARDRLNRMIFRASAVAIAFASFIAAGVAGASAIRDKIVNRGKGSGVITTAHAEQVTTEFGEPVTIDSAGGNTEHPQTPPAQRPPIARVNRGRVSPILPAGESILAEGVVATRADSEVTVSFDSPNLRTRRRDKFERFLRTTLPMVYGPSIQTALGSVPEGAIAAQGDLITEMTAHGVQIPLDSGWAVRVYPETRPGQDGPLVVRYRARVTTTRE